VGDGVFVTLRVSSEEKLDGCGWICQRRKVSFLLDFHFSPLRMIVFLNPISSRRRPAFSLLEMVVVLTIITVLTVAGLSFMGGTGASSRKAGTEMLRGLIEQARTRAITMNRPILLAIAEPGDLSLAQDRCQIGLFSIESYSELIAPVRGTLLGRWQALEPGVILIGGSDGGVINPLDQAELNVIYGGEKNLKVTVHGIVFQARGGLLHPPGVGSLELRIAEGGYRGSPKKPQPLRRGDDGRPVENRLKIGRVIARSYPVDG
jgi:prepilin-type N-terminal cleavage/methylation domain-containing protein